MASIIIDAESKLQILIARIKDHLDDDQDQLLFIDLEGVNLCRQGTIAIMQLLMPPSPAVFLIDVHNLGIRTFDIATDDGTSLKSILESETIYKIFFDIRNDSDALHGLFGINVKGIIDLQVLEYVTRQPRGKFVNGLAKCIDNDLPYSARPGWAQTKADGRRLFAPEVGGKYGVFLERPIPAEIVKYCEQDVLLMPRLLACYGPKLLPGVAAQIQNIVDDRVGLSKMPQYNGKGRHMVIGPSLEPSRNFADATISPGVNLVCSSALSQLCRLNDTVDDDLVMQFSNLKVRGEPVNEPDDAFSTSSSKTTSRSALSTGMASAVSQAADGAAGIASGQDSEPEDEFETNRYAADTGGYSTDSDNDSIHDRDYTACSAEDCGYCGRCRY